MKYKIILFVSIVLSSICTAFALAYSVQLKPSDQNLNSNILIRSKPDYQAGYRNYWVAVLPQNGFANSNLSLASSLSIYERSNLVVESAVEGVTVSGIRTKKWGSSGVVRYNLMTNLFSNPLNGAELFTFRVATNVLANSTFTLYDRGLTADDDSRWFYLKDF